METRCKCGSYAINHRLHGRDGSDGGLCDVCYWRSRAPCSVMAGYIISGPLRDAERSIGLALSRLGKIKPGGIGAWVGAWDQYKSLARLMIKTRALADEIEEREGRGIRR